MKPFKTHIANFFLVLSLFLVSGQTFAAPNTQVATNSTNSTSYSVENSSKQQFFEEVAEITVSYEQTDEPVYPLPLFYTKAAANDAVAYYIPSVTAATSLHFRDVKKQLEQQLFPFHFFW
ncbi:hypothetical protein [Marixanthomonas spongiae]|uniref:Uncharacterized protein n=1 Tax=Marixanthomonas spongiae TaxID=2174845 RepID=A0A2U0I1V6_9FLAO|nr:hypothetical protein [Marixanthomonas spongiae]PVW15101.1 hypothetical protein DDV96_06750 [Marixanthomonas spongiae]